MSEPLLTYRGAVYPWHCDHMGHMNVMWYVGKFDEGTWNLFDVIGFTKEFMREHGSAAAGVEQKVTYKKELHAGDTISVYTSVIDVRERVVQIRHEMRDKTGVVAAIMILTAVHLDQSGRRATAFPESIRARLAELCVVAA